MFRGVQQDNRQPLNNTRHKLTATHAHVIANDELRNNTEQTEQIHDSKQTSGVAALDPYVLRALQRKMPEYNTNATHKHTPAASFQHRLCIPDAQPGLHFIIRQ